MTREDCDHLIQTLTKALDSNGLGWVMDEFETHISVGKLETKEVRFENETEFRNLGQKRSVLTTVPYTPHEQAEILLTCIQKGVIDVYRLNESVHRKLAELENKGSPLSIEFERDKFQDEFRDLLPQSEDGHVKKSNHTFLFKGDDEKKIEELEECCTEMKKLISSNES